MSKETLQLLAGIVFAVGFLPYCYAILTGKGRPSRVTWVIWVSLDILTFVALYVQGTVNGQIIGAVAGGLVVLVLSVRYGIPGWTRLDKLCLAGAILGILLWQFSGSALVGLSCSLTTLLVGSFPTFVSAWNHPEREDKWAWTIYWISCLLALAGVPKWTFADAGAPLTFTIIESIMMVLLWVRPRFKR